MRARDEAKANTLYKKNSIKEMIPHEKKTENKKPLQDEWEWGAWIATVVIKHSHTHWSSNSSLNAVGNKEKRKIVTPQS